MVEDKIEFRRKTHPVGIVWGRVMRSILRELPPRTHAPGEFLSVIAYVPRMWHRDTFKFLSTQTSRFEKSRHRILE